MVDVAELKAELKAAEENLKAVDKELTRAQRRGDREEIARWEEDAIKYRNEISALKSEMGEAGTFAKLKGFVKGSPSQGGKEGGEEHQHKSGVAAGAIIVFAFLIIIAKILGILGGIPAIYLTGVLFLFMILGIYTISKTGNMFLGGIFIFVMLIAALFPIWLDTTTLGQSFELGGQRTGVQLSERFRGLTGPLNVVSQIFKGEYNPENLWRSDVARSEYQQVQDVGVTMEDVRPRKDFFFSGTEDVEIQGRINIVGFPGTFATARLGACTIVTDQRGIQVCSENPVDVFWGCEPETVQATELRNKVFRCFNTNAVEVGNRVLAVEVNVTAADTRTVAGKQFAFADPDVLVTLDDPLSEFEIPKDAVQSWQAGDNSINVGIGVTGDLDVLEASEFDYFIGLNIQNPATRTGVATLKSATFFLPAGSEINNPMTITDPEDFSVPLPPTNTACVAATEQDFIDLNLQPPAGQNIVKCTANFDPRLNILRPGERSQVFLRFKVPEEKLQGQTFSTFFVLARVDYDYTNKVSVPVTVRVPPA